MINPGQANRVRERTHTNPSLFVADAPLKLLVFQKLHDLAELRHVARLAQHLVDL